MKFKEGLMKNYLTRRSASVAISLFLTSQLFFSTSAIAEEEYVCEARQSSNNELPVLSKECPIGKGLWGRAPSPNDDLFWVQCGIFPEPLTLDQVKPIYEKISVDVWLKPEGNGYRCLIGPYDNYKSASAEVGMLKKLPRYKDAFIRTVNTKSPSKPKAKAVPKAKPVAPVAKVPEPKKQDKPVDVIAQANKQSESAVQSDETIVIRREAAIEGKKFVIPFLMEGNEQFYMEYNIAWNRLSYTKSGKVCRSIGMSLVDEENWMRLINSKVMSQKQWPLHLPYWGAGKRGLFTSGKVTQLTGTSLLNVMCMK